MDKKLLVIVLAILVVIGGSVGYLLISDDAKVAKNDTAGTSQTTLNMPSQDKDEASPQGAYIDYSEDVIANTDGTKLLFFHAPWCPQCRDIEADIKTQGAPAGVTIIKVDYDTNQALRKKYGVALQTTVVRIDDDGELVKKFVAYDDPSLESIKNNLL